MVFLKPVLPSLLGSLGEWRVPLCSGLVRLGLRGAGSRRELFWPDGPPLEAAHHTGTYTTLRLPG